MSTTHKFRFPENGLTTNMNNCAKKLKNDLISEK